MSPAAAGLVLAAGTGSRFGRAPKLLAEIDGRPLLQYAVDALVAVPELDPVIVVLGAHAGRLQAGVEFGRARTVLCADWAAGLSASLRCGVAAQPGAQRVLVALGDTPGLTPAVVERMLTAQPGTRACYGGIPGHPVLLGPEQLAGLDTLRGDVGARELLAGSDTIECGDLASGADVDTPADLDELSLRPRAPRAAAAHRSQGPASRPPAGAG
ncbi:MAG TPA: nucleotidyltransferase family protein [Solirubrobacteraceae bacterium]|jgi:CTP:molybdopterin cytidylyltransferase MocA|nr:nucleotidyltransferase family protein [Solirubrobacteraceae bacterium]